MSKVTPIRSQHQIQSTVPQYRETRPTGPLTDTSRYDGQIRMARKIGWVTFRDQDDRITQTEWDFINAIYDRVLAGKAVGS